MRERDIRHFLQHILSMATVAAAVGVNRHFGQREFLAKPTIIGSGPKPAPQRSGSDRRRFVMVRAPLLIGDELRQKRAAQHADERSDQARKLLRKTSLNTGLATNHSHTTSPSTTASSAPCVVARFQYTPIKSGTKAPTSGTW